MGKHFFFAFTLSFVTLNLFQVEAFAKPEPNYTHVTEKLAPKTLNTIQPSKPVSPFTQWNSNNGYCGEVSFMQANLNQGQWMSQYNVRLVCGTGLSQSGPDGYCEANHGSANYNSQFLIENAIPGDSRFANAEQCLKNARLDYALYNYGKAAKGIDGYKQYLSWIKSQVIAGRMVAIAVLNFAGGDSQYDHEVTVTQIGTNHAPNDATYYDDDVLYFDDHSHGGTSFSQGYTFQSLAKTREQANAPGAHTFSILIPGAFPVYSQTGGDGEHNSPRKLTASNFAFSVGGVSDRDQVTLPVTLTLVGSSSHGHANTPEPIINFNFESPGLESSCTNKPPEWMSISLKVVVSGLTLGTAYNLYEYDLNAPNGIGDQAALPIPVARFNAQAGLASHATAFVANAQTFTQTIQSTSDKIIAFRAVKATAP